MDYKERIKIEKYEDGFVITIREKNWVKTGHFVVPCFLRYRDQRLIELHSDFLVDHSTIEKRVYEGDEFNRMLPNLFENSELLPRNESGDPIFNLTNSKE